MMTITPQSHRSAAAPLALSTLCLSAMLAVLPIPASAAPPSTSAPETAVATVSLENLDLTTSSGLKSAEDRLAVAVRRLCQQFADERKVSNTATLTDCYRDTLASSLRQLNARLATTTTERSQLARNSKEKP